MKNKLISNFIKLNILIFIMFQLMSCGVSNEEKAKRNSLAAINLHYDTLINKFNKELVSHFPGRIDTNIKRIASRTGNTASSYHLFVVRKYNKIESIYENYKNKALEMYDMQDTCLLIVNRYETDSNIYNINKNDIYFYEINKQCYKNKHPIPNFHKLKNCRNKEKQNRLAEDFTIMILNSHKGEFKDIKMPEDTWYMPEGWEDGFSEGVAISKKRNILINWVVVW